MITGGGNAANEAQKAREEQQRREAEIKSGTADVRQRFAGIFDNDYYAKLKKDMNDYYMTAKGTGLNDQFQEAKTGLSAALVGRGLDSSSVGLRLNKKLTDQNRQNADNITEMGLNAVNAKKQDVLGAQNNVIAQLQNSGDAAMAMAQASQAASVNQNRPAYSPLGSVFQDVTAGLATQADMERQGINRYNIFNRGSGGNRYMRTVGG